MIDGGPGAAPSGRIDAWLVTDARAELISALRRLARRCRLIPEIRAIDNRTRGRVLGRIWFAGRVGGHASVAEVCASAERNGVRRLVIAHVGRPTLTALDRGLRLPWGELGREGRTYRAGSAAGAGALSSVSP